MAFNRPTAMIADSDAAVRSSLRFAFEVQGIAARTTAERSEQISGLSLRGIDCLVIDRNLLGSDSAVEMRRLSEWTPIIVIATNPEMRLIEAVKAAGAWLIEKPLIGDTLIDLVHSLTKPAAAA